MRGSQRNVTVSSRANDAFRRLRRLAASPRERRRRGLCLLEGERLVRAAAGASADIRTLVFTPQFLESGAGASLAALSPGAEVVLLKESLFRDLSSLKTPGEVLAVAPVPAPPDPLEAGDLLFVDGVQDPGNLGMIIRSAAAAAVGAVLLSGDSADPWSPKVMRAGMGAHFHVSVGQGVPLPQAAASFPGEVVALHHRAEKSIYETDLTVSPLALVIGAEGRGVSPELAGLARRKASIPMPGWSEPLNAAAAATVCLFEMVRQRAGGGGAGRL